MVGYGVMLTMCGVPFVVWHPRVLMRAPLYMVLAALSFLAAWLRCERTLWGNAACCCRGLPAGQEAGDWGGDTPHSFILHLVQGR